MLNQGDDEVDGELIAQRREQRKKMQQEQRDRTYFERLTEAIEVFKESEETEFIQKLKIERFPLLISNLDQILKSFLDFDHKL